jgi:hypothetical protein
MRDDIDIRLWDYYLDRLEREGKALESMNNGNHLKSKEELQEQWITKLLSLMNTSKN